MERREIERLRLKVFCGCLLEGLGWNVDLKESTRRAVKYRCGAKIIIVTHEGRGWFDAHSEAKGDVFALVTYLTGQGFGASLDHVARLAGVPAPAYLWTAPVRRDVPASIADRWRHRRSPWRGSATAGYLGHTRALPWEVISAAIGRDLLREGPHGSVWGRHSDAAGAVIGWEERGPAWRGYATGGAKELFRFGADQAPRICVTEASIDAMSLAALEKLRADTLYVSTGGGWAPRTQAALEHHAGRVDAHLVAAIDANVQGDIYADRIRQVADTSGCDFSRLRPRAEDWNDELKRSREEDRLASAVRQG